MGSCYRVYRQCFRTFPNVSNGNGRIIDVLAIEVPSDTYGQISRRYAALYGYGLTVIHRFITKVERKDLGRDCGDQG